MADLFEFPVLFPLMVSATQAQKKKVKNNQD